MRIWSAALKNPQAKLVGFDSFEGLPEDWHAEKRAGHFYSGGNIPVIDDDQVSFIKGWFDETVPGFEPPDHDRLIMNLDADLYSSTKTALEWAAPRIRPGDILYFDEFFDRNHEMRAFDEFLKSSGLKFRLYGATMSCTEVAFLCVA